MTFLGFSLFFVDQAVATEKRNKAAAINQNDPNLRLHTSQNQNHTTASAGIGIPPENVGNFQNIPDERIAIPENQNADPLAPKIEADAPQKEDPGNSKN
jgi:hypothetical protein